MYACCQKWEKFPWKKAFLIKYINQASATPTHTHMHADNGRK